jgi:hypothetical protein
MAYPSLIFQPPTFNMVSQKGGLYDDESHNRGDESFSDKYQRSKTTNASSLATTVSDSATGDGLELVAGRCHVRTQARKYDDRWMICMGPRTCKRTGQQGKREKGAVGKPGFYVAVYNNGGKQKVGVLKDTLMSEKEARDAYEKQNGRRQLVLPVPLRVIIYGSKKASPNAWGNVKPDMKLPAKAVSDTLPGETGGGRDRVSNVGGLFWRFKAGRT